MPYRDEKYSGPSPPTSPNGSNILDVPVFYSDVGYKFVHTNHLENLLNPGQSKRIIKIYKRRGFNIDVMRQYACLVVNPITIYNYGFRFE